jgi:alkyl sulfatase BDS1-like metallo-beta-lactamase superfamily hydrolase
MSEIRDLAERFWAGEVDPAQLWTPTGAREEIAPGLWFVHAFANVSVAPTADGLVMIDTSNYAARDKTFAAVRAIDADPLFAAIYTHGHADHACGLPPFLADARSRGAPAPRIVGHRNVAARFDRYKTTNGYNALINARQFNIPARWPTEYDYPDTVYDERLAVTAGALTLELHHARGETDDHSWLWWAAARVLFTGDLFIWVAPNAGNPQKVHRYAAEWAAALRAMQALEPEILVPGHGVPIFGAARVGQALDDTARWLEHLVAETVRRMNAGATLGEIVAAVTPPDDLAPRPYLQAVYDEPEFVVRNIWRLYGGWWDGTPSRLKPASDAAIGREVAALAGGLDALIARAKALADGGDLPLASHLIDWAAAAEPESREVHAVRAEIYAARAASARALMTRGIFGATARESAERAKR